MTAVLAVRHGACALCTTDAVQTWHDDPDHCPKRQPRDNAVPCQRCRIGRTYNPSAICDPCKAARS